VLFVFVCVCALHVCMSVPPAPLDCVPLCAVAVLGGCYLVLAVCTTRQLWTNECARTALGRHLGLGKHAEALMRVLQDVWLQLVS
jgi:hypothetical protein